MSSASNVVKVELKGNLLLTVDKNDDTRTNPRDTIRIWRRKLEEPEIWKQEMYIDRAHISLISDVRIIEYVPFLLTKA